MHPIYIKYKTYPPPPPTLLHLRHTSFFLFGALCLVFAPKGPRRLPAILSTHSPASTRHCGGLPAVKAFHPLLYISYSTSYHTRRKACCRGQSVLNRLYYAFPRTHLQSTDSRSLHLRQKKLISRRWMSLLSRDKAPHTHTSSNRTLPLIARLCRFGLTHYNKDGQP